MSQDILDIAQVAKASGFSASALRYYETQGLIASVGRHGLRRQYHASVLDRLSLISLGQMAGLSLTEISAFYTKEGNLSIDRDTLLDKADEVEQTIAQLTAVRDGLRHVAQCPEVSHLDCLKFKHLMRLAVRKQKQTR